MCSEIRLVHYGVSLLLKALYYDYNLLTVF